MAYSVDPEDYLTPETGLAVAATALVMSPPVRRTIRRGLVLGLAGVFGAGAVVGRATRGIRQDVQQVVHPDLPPEP
jgi:hypothetical protein